MIAPPEDLIKAVRVVAAGESLLAPSITRRIIEEFAKLRPRHDITEEVKGLTERELEVPSGARARILERRAGGAPARHRGDREDPCVQSPGQARTSRQVQAVDFAYERGLVHPSAPNVTSVETRP
jgi:hypothetical protein